MPSPTPSNLLQTFLKLGEFLRSDAQELLDVFQAAQHSNAWFTPEMTEKSLRAFGAMLNREDLTSWFKDIPYNEQPKKIGLILAGNIPAVGFHDILCVIATGNHAVIKQSSSDDKLIPFLLDKLVNYLPEISDQLTFADRLVDFDAVIATGSNNSSRYFDYYFGKVPNIIRKNRTSVAVLTGKETSEMISQLGHDIFDYYGLGCRNVSKVYFPENYDVHSLFEPMEMFQPIVNHFKYNNNYDYNKSIYLVNRVDHFDNGFVLMKPDEGFASPLAVLFYERYKELSEVETQLTEVKEQLQCVVSEAGIFKTIDTIHFGGSQEPKIGDYADNINTVEFLKGLI